MAADLSKKQRRRIGFFLIGLLVAICVEIAVDWNATFYEITVLRNSLQQKGENYADILRQAATDAMLAYDWDALDRLSARLFDDDDVVYVRFTDVLGNTIYDRLRADYGAEFKKRRGNAFRAYYRRVMDRDARGITSDPQALKARYEASRHKDIIQKFNDLQMMIVRKFSTPKEGAEEVARTLYQDRLADKDGSLDRSVSYSVGAVTSEMGEPFGAILIAFRNDRLNSGTKMKLWKGTAITVFFVGLIIFQNIGSRRSKMRLEALERALGHARAAVAGYELLPTVESGIVLHRVPSKREVGASLCIVRAVGDGHEVLLAEPSDPGIDAAFAICAFAEDYLAIDLGMPIAEKWQALGAAVERSPLRRGLIVILLRTTPTSVEALTSLDVPIYARQGGKEELLDLPAAVDTPLGKLHTRTIPRSEALILSSLRDEATRSVLHAKKGIAKELEDVAEELHLDRDAWILILPAAPAPPPAAAS